MPVTPAIKLLTSCLAPEVHFKSLFPHRAAAFRAFGKQLSVQVSEAA